MKICILGNTGKDINRAYSWFVKTTVQGMRLNGHTVFGYDYKSHNINQIYEFLFNTDIDILFTHLTFHKHHKVENMLGIFDELKTIKDTKIIHTMQDARVEPRYKKDISSFFDMALVGQTENIPKFQKHWKIPIYYWPYSSITYDSLGKYDRNLDFNVPVFPGSASTHKDRSVFIKLLQRKLNIKLIGTKSKEDIRDKTQNFSVSSPCVLGLSTRYDWKIGGYVDVRPFQYGGNGAIMICRLHKGQENLLPPDLYYTIDSYGQTGANQLVDHWNRIKKLNENQKNEIRSKIFNFIQQKHSSYIRMKQTIELIKGERKELDL